MVVIRKGASLHQGQATPEPGRVAKMEQSSWQQAKRLSLQPASTLRWYWVEDVGRVPGDWKFQAQSKALDRVRPCLQFSCTRRGAPSLRHQHFFQCLFCSAALCYFVRCDVMLYILMNGIGGSPAREHGLSVGVIKLNPTESDPIKLHASFLFSHTGSTRLASTRRALG